MRVQTALSLDDLAKAAGASLYPVTPQQQSWGWGSVVDDESVVNQDCQMTFQASSPQILAATQTLPRRLRLRSYYDQPDAVRRKVHGASAPWSLITVRRAIDFIIFDGNGNSVGYEVLAGVRNDDEFRKKAVAAIQRLDSNAVIATDVIPESLTPEFYQWMLYRLHRGDPLAAGIYLDEINEMTASDKRVRRGAKFTESAPLDRADLAVLLAIGSSALGPAKLAVSSMAVDAQFKFELHLDGGFAVFKSSQYSASALPTTDLEWSLVEDLWYRVLPDIRASFNADGAWRTSGRDDLKKTALNSVRTILGI